MTDDEILKYRELIAVFMELELHEGGFLYPMRLPQFHGSDHREWCCSDDNGNWIICSENMKYDTSWDWLMPVVEKIESLKFRVKICGFTSFGKQYNECHIKKNDSEGLYVYNHEGIGYELKIEAVWIAIIEFIQWHSNQIKTTDNE